MIFHTKKPILYVDDTVEQRYAMRRILETEGYTVLEAGSGREALALLPEAPALAVIDVRLPDVNGYDLTREIKHRLPHVPVLQVSASFSDPDLRASGLSGGADAYIAQPVHPLEFAALIRRMLQTVEAEQSLRFLAAIGPRISASLSLEDTCRNIRGAIVPHFADRCVLMVRGVPGQEGPFWSETPAADDPLFEAMQGSAVPKECELIHSRLLMASLHAGDRRLGAIAFVLQEDREYSSSDCLLAMDLSSRSAMAVQNCLLLASEQSARNALVQAETLATAGRMAAAIAHEVNNPLEALTNLIYLLETSPEAAPSQRELASSALIEVTRLAHITNQTLGFYRDLRKPDTLDLSDTVEETVALYRTRLERHGIRVEESLTPKVTIRGIKGEIRQVLTNLLINALDAMGQGGCIQLRTEIEGDLAVLTVADDGPGIEASALGRIFEAFFSTKKGTGTGLGLWITRNIIEKHKGTIDVQSRVDVEHGTTFVLRFPLCREAGETAG